MCGTDCKERKVCDTDFEEKTEKFMLLTVKREISVRCEERDKLVILTVYVEIYLQ